jgi:hypothetical protein
VGGWRLALADDEQSSTRLVLWEPCSGAEIPLPPLAHVLQVFLSADPLASASSGWMAVATQARDSVFHNLFFWRPGDAAWSAAAEVYPRERLHSVAFHGGYMYCMDSLKRLAVYTSSTLGRTTTGSPPVLHRGMYVGYEISNMLCNSRCGKEVHGTRAAHFVTCNGELLLVVLFYDRHPSFAEVYRQNNLMPGRDLELGERVMDLGGYSLFLGRGDAFALSAHEFPAAIRQNCVYYAVHALNSDLKDWVFVFDLETDALEKFPFPQEREGDPGKECRPISWFCPKRPIVKK